MIHRFVLLIILFNLTYIPLMAQRMMFEDTSRIGLPYAKDPHVVKFKGRYLMYYSIPPRQWNGMEGWNIGIAESQDLVNWKRVGEITPQPGLAYEEKGLCAPGAIVSKGRVHLFYQTYGNGPKDAICHAVSRDGINFTRLSDKPFKPNGKPGEWNSSESGHPHLFTDKNGRTYLFYQGNPDNGKTWLITQEEVHWTNNTPNL